MPFKQQPAAAACGDTPVYQTDHTPKFKLEKNNHPEGTGRLNLFTTPYLNPAGVGVILKQVGPCDWSIQRIAACLLDKKMTATSSNSTPTSPFPFLQQLHLLLQQLGCLVCR